MKLRGYQERTIRTVDDEHARGGKAILVAAPTGAGKGTMAAHLLARHAKRGERGLFLVHRREIVRDIADRIEALGIPTNAVMGETKARHTRALVDVATVQTLLLGETKLGRYDLGVVDEAHHYGATSWLETLESLKLGWKVGFTATPARADGRPLSMFDRLIESVRYSELLRDGYIVPTRVLRPPTALGADLAQEPADAYFRYTKGATAFVFVSSVELAERTAERMTRGGCEARVICHSTKPGDREEYISQLKRGKIRAVVNVDTMTEGVDVPSVNAIILGRACHHTSTYLQAGGRGMRPDGKKTECILLDLSGASYSHGRPDIDRAYSLEGNQGIGFALNEGEELMKRRTSDAERAERKESEIIGLDLVEYNEADQQAKGQRIINWDAAGLGLDTDQRIADRLGVSETTVLLARQRRGIPGFRKVIDWDRVVFDKRDEEIAAELGCARVTVAHARKARKIPMANSKVKPRIDWDNVALGTKTDSELAKELGCSVQSVYYARQKRGIEACLYQAVIARGGVPPKHRGGAAKKLDFSRQPLGEVPDADIAKKLECSVRAVKMARQMFGIPACNPSADRKIDLSKAPLGKKSDAEVARMFKCSEHRVWKERNERGIRPFSPRNRPDGSGGPKGRKPGRKPEQAPIVGKASERWRAYAAE